MKSIEVSGLIKNYGKIKAVDGIDFSVDSGSLFAFLGPNGAGKSTTIDILCTLLRPDGGRAAINGLEIGRQDEKIRREIGVVFQEGVLDRLLSVRENLMLRGSFYGFRGEELKKRAFKIGRRRICPEKIRAAFRRAAPPRGYSQGACEFS